MHLIQNALRHLRAPSHTLQHLVALGQLPLKVDDLLAHALLGIAAAHDGDARIRQRRAGHVGNDHHHGKPALKRRANGEVLAALVKLHSNVVGHKRKHHHQPEVGKPLREHLVATGQLL